MNFLSSLPAGVNLSGSGIEFVILGGLLLLSFLLAVFLGKGKMIAVILAFYPALFFYSQFPLADKLMLLKNSDWQIFLNQFLMFLLFFVPTFLIINIITGKTLAYTERNRKFALLILGAGFSLLTLVFVHQIIEFEKIKTYFPLTGNIWSSESLLFWLLIIPVILILLFIRR